MSNDGSPFATDTSPAPTSQSPPPRSQAPYLVASGCGCLLLVALGIGVLSGFVYFTTENLKLQRELSESRQALKVVESDMRTLQQRAQRSAAPAVDTQSRALLRRVNELETALRQANDATAQAMSRLSALGMGANQPEDSDTELSTALVTRMVASGNPETQSTAIEWMKQQEAWSLTERNQILQTAMSRYGYDTENTAFYEEVIRTVASPDMATLMSQSLHLRSNARVVVLPLLAEYKDPQTVPAILLSMSDPTAAELAKRTLLAFGADQVDAVRPHVLDATNGPRVRDVLRAWELDPNAIVLEELKRRIEANDRRTVTRNLALLMGVPVDDKYREVMNLIITSSLRDMLNMPQGMELVRKWSDESLWKRVVAASTSSSSSSSFQRPLMAVLIEAKSPTATALLYQQVGYNTDNEKAMEELVTRSEELLPLALEDLNTSDSRKRAVARNLLRTIDAEPRKLVQRTIQDLAGPVEGKRQFALQTLVEVDVVTELQGEVVDVLDEITAYATSSQREELVVCWSRWHTPLREDVSLKLCASKNLRLNEVGLKALLTSNSTKLQQAAGPVFEKVSGHKGVVDAMIRSQEDVEPLVLQLLSTVQSHGGRAAICQVLAARGTRKSLPLLNAMIEKEGKVQSSAIRSAKFAVKAIETREAEEKTQKTLETP